jgi:hypothetical protein
MSMSDFVESAKSSMSAAVSRISWEAQKQMRVRNKQSEIDKLMEQRRQLLDELGQVAMNLYQQGMLHDPQLTRLCASIIELDHDVGNRQVQLQDLKKEAYPVNQFAPAPTMNYAPPSVPPIPPPTPGPDAGTQSSQLPQSQRCPTCGSPVRLNALYCRNCGTKLR